MPNFFMPRFPFHNYHTYLTHTKPQPRHSTITSQEHLSSCLDTLPSLSDSDTRQSDSNDISNKKDPLLEIFGINLFFDDILIICLLFFLYSEGVKDEMLFIALILLLLS